jgi:hypothetical protein
MCRYGALPHLSAEQIAQAFGALPTTKHHVAQCGAIADEEAQSTHISPPAYTEPPQQVSVEVELPQTQDIQHHSAPRHEPVVIPRPDEATIVVTVLGTTDAKYRVPVSRIHHMPSFPQRVRVLCPMYDPAYPHESCMMGDNCQHVHADVRGLVVVCAHINYAWRSLDDVTYARHAAGDVVHVAAPNCGVEVDVMDSGSLLVTKALESNRRPLTHCAHYYLNRRCNLGPDCRFVHAVFVNENARPRQRAPAPVQLGREVLPTRRSDIIASDASPVYATQAESTPKRALSSNLSSTSDHGSSLHAASQSVTSGLSTPEFRGTSPSQHRRWRHDPYTAAAYVLA